MIFWQMGYSIEYSIYSGYERSECVVFTVTFAAAAIFSYWWLIPTGLFGLLVWRGSQSGYTYMEIICVYGYSLAIYIPISVRLITRYEWFTVE